MQRSLGSRERRKAPYSHSNLQFALCWWRIPRVPRLELPAFEHDNHARDLRAPAIGGHGLGPRVVLRTRHRRSLKLVPQLEVHTADISFWATDEGDKIKAEHILYQAASMRMCSPDRMPFPHITGLSNLHNSLLHFFEMLPIGFLVEL